MPVCPECGKQIDELNAFAKEESKYTVVLETFDDGSHSLNYDYQQCVGGSTSGTDFMCPKCEQSLFLIEDEDTQPEEVINFLRGKTDA
jgi:predicted RNA-binding Zn-ribbon protein involved in translation (DUF1610 family)